MVQFAKPSSRVFLVEAPFRKSLDLGAAERYGSIEYLFPVGKHRSALFQTNELMREIVRAARDVKFNPRADLLCLAGSMNLNVFAVVALLSEYPMIRVLAFSATDNAYVERELSTVLSVEIQNDEARTGV